MHVVYKKILYTATEESRDGEVPKMIFFVHDTLDTIDLRDDIIRWLRRWNKPSSIVQMLVSTMVLSQMNQRSTFKLSTYIGSAGSIYC